VFDLDDKTTNHIRGSFTLDEINALCVRSYYISGGTGFVGKWIISTINSLAGKKSKPQIRVISRSPFKAKKHFIHLKNISVLDWRELNSHTYPKEGDPEIVAFHSSVPAASGVNISENEIDKFKDSTETYTNFLISNYKNPVFINLSSGTVYERPSSGLISELNATKKNNSLSIYDLVKMSDEEIVRELTLSGKIVGANPRLFSFTGPGLEIPGNYALTSFMQDAIQGKAVRITGSPSSLRSYMSPIDMSIWILKSSLYPTTEVIHIGSSEGLSMYEIAGTISRKFGNGLIQLPRSTELKPEAYVPETKNSARLLNISSTLSFEESLENWSVKVADH
jgi:UDP-glucuronate decarboxylase